MSEWKSLPGTYPRTLNEAYEQGKRDKRAGYPRTWTGNLGPNTARPGFWEAWEAGWDGDLLPDGSDS